MAENMHENLAYKSYIKQHAIKDLDNNYNIDDWCDDFHEILQILDIDKIDICGYSMGARLGIAFASKYPNKINKLIMSLK